MGILVALASAACGSDGSSSVSNDGSDVGGAGGVSGGGTGGAVGGATGDAGPETDAAPDGALGDSGDPEGGEPISDGLPAGVFGGGPFYEDADTVLPRMKASGFNTLILWTLHLRDNGDLVYNDIPIIGDGAYVGDADWPAKVADLKVPPTTVTRLEFGVGSAGVSDFERIEALVETEGTGPGTTLRRNFAQLRATFPSVDAINLDDESNYDVASTVAFSLMLGELGYRVTFVPYTAMSFWTGTYDQLEAQAPGLVDRVLLQVYAGGAGNDPADWAGRFGDVGIEVGLWSRHGAGCRLGDTPAQVQSKLEAWRDSTVGGWMWLLDDMLACDQTRALEEYADAIHQVYD